MTTLATTLATSLQVTKPLHHLAPTLLRLRRSSLRSSSPHARRLSEVLSLHRVVPRLVRLSNHHPVLLDRQTLRGAGPLGATRSRSSLVITAMVPRHLWMGRASNAGSWNAWLITIFA
jgi:hypothetical protein